ncbi:hypothetical protein BTVI_92643 [Pitangus sulphuratus]|nr:hypothetical protein BTVI_92643 [Pitangus sulphuratus]
MSDRAELDLTGAKQNTGMWLVKVPKYLSQQWNKASGRGEVGKLRIVNVFLMVFLKYVVILEDAAGTSHTLDNSALHIDSSGHLEQAKKIKFDK